MASVRTGLEQSMRSSHEAAAAAVADSIVAAARESKQKQARALGLLVGLAAGDRNGGPVQMALALAESMLAVSATPPSPSVRCAPAASFAGLVRWYDRRRGVDAWDTGPTAAHVLDRFAAPLAAAASADTSANSIDDASATTSSTIDERAVRRVARRLDAETRGRTAGCNAVHRVAPLALAFDGSRLDSIPIDKFGLLSGDADATAVSSHVTDKALIAAAMRESSMTHYSPLSQYAAALMCVLCRALVSGLAWRDACRHALSAIDVFGRRRRRGGTDEDYSAGAGGNSSRSGAFHTIDDGEDDDKDDDSAAAALGVVTGAFRRAIDDAAPIGVADLDAGGFAPHALAAAVFFVDRHASFDSALNASIAFAGAANYCPVLVGALAGARWGVLSIAAELTAHCRDGVMARCRAAAAALFASSASLPPALVSLPSPVPSQAPVPLPATPDASQVYPLTDSMSMRLALPSDVRAIHALQTAHYDAALHESVDVFAAIIGEGHSAVVTLNADAADDRSMVAYLLVHAHADPSLPAPLNAYQRAADAPAPSASPASLLSNDMHDSATPRASTPTCAYFIHDLLVAPAHRSGGVAARLVRARLDALRGIAATSGDPVIAMHGSGRNCTLVLGASVPADGSVCAASADGFVHNNPERMVSGRDSDSGDAVAIACVSLPSAVRFWRRAGFVDDAAHDDDDDDDVNDAGGCGDASCIQSGVLARARSERAIALQTALASYPPGSRFMRLAH